MKIFKIVLIVLLIHLQIVEINAQTELLYGYEAEAIVEGASIVRLKGEEKQLSYVLYEDNQRPSLTNFLEFFKTQCKIHEKYSFELIDTQKDQLGQEHYRYQQYFNEIPLRTAHIVVHAKDGEVLSVSGLIYQKELEVPTSKIEESFALKNALAAVPAVIYKWEVEEEENHLKLEQNNQEASYYPHGELYYIGQDLSLNHKEQRLCYKFDIYVHEPIARKEVYVDVETAEVIFQEELIKYANVPAVGATAYSGNQTIMVDSVSPNVFRLRESTRGQGVRTFNLQGGNNYGNATDFIDSTNSWTNFSPAIDRYALDAHWGAEMTYDYFLQKHNRNSIDNQGFPLLSYIHYKTGYVNAFWDGLRMTYGDGDNTRTPLTTLDISGHEIAHGLTRFTSNLVYAKESGALNESFSDIFGVEIERFARPNNWNWTIGEQIGGAFRSFSNPKIYNNPNTYGGDLWHDQKGCVPQSNNDQCGVHSNSGVQNYWFYLLSMGGSGTNDLGHSYHVNALGNDSAAAITFRNNTLYLTPASDFEDARFFSFIAAVDLYGSCSPAVESTINAWHAVGVGEAYINGLQADFVAVNDTAFCADYSEVKFKYLGYNIYDFKWDFGDGNSSILPNPTHTYSSYGNYTVTLYADGLSCGKDTLVKQQYINIDSNILCVTKMQEESQTVTDCEGRFYDQGGLNGNYENNHTDTLHIIPSSDADFILLEFTSFDVEAGNIGFCNRDYIEVFDGPTTDAPSLGRFCNNILPPDSIFSSYNALTIVFFTDRYASGRGYGATWKCMNSQQIPQADFITNVDSSCNGIVKFTNTSTQGGKSFLWNFGDGNTSTAIHPKHEYYKNGDYNVSLTVTNAMGQDVKVKNELIHVLRPTMSKIKEDTFCLNSNVKLGVPAVGKNRWYRASDTTQYFFIGDTLRLSKLDTTQTYYVENVIEEAAQNTIPIMIAGNHYISDSTAAIYFDVHQPLILESVILHVDETRYRTVELRDKNGGLVSSRTVYVSKPGLQVSLDFEIYPDTAYSLTIADRDPGARINSNGASYPYSIPGLIDINRSSLGGDIHPFFYYWTVKPLDCISVKEKVTVYVDTTCVPVSVKNTSLNQENISIQPNPFLDNFSLKLPLINGTYELFLYDVNGRLVQDKQLNGAQQIHNVNTAKLAQGIYFLRVKSGTEIYQQKIIKYSRH